MKPIVFIHGLGPSHRTYTFDCHEEYFFQNGYVLYIMKLPFGGLLENKAQAVAEQLKELDLGSFHMFGHSAGGLIGRLLLQNYPKIAEKCISFTSICTPHKGTPIADAVLNPKFPDFNFLLLHELMDHLEGREVVEQMSVKYWLDHEIQDSPLVQYFSMPHYMKAWKAHKYTHRNFEWLVSQVHDYNDCTVPMLYQMHGTIIKDPKTDFYLEGSHAAAITNIYPFGKYGSFPWSKIWERNMDLLFEVFRMAEKKKG
jgi:pimeloyl-ACP methyl ester carboxylesterase